MTYYDFPSTSASSSGWCGGGMPYGCDDPGPAPAAPAEPEVDNLKKSALNEVLTVINDAVSALDADDEPSSTDRKARKLTEGIGGEDPAWQSPLADQLAERLASAVDAVAANFTSLQTEVNQDWENEPSKVAESDYRAKWGTV